MAQFPAMPFFFDAYMLDCGHLTDAEHGRYLLLLKELWTAPNQRLPNDDEWLARKFRRSVEDVKSQLRPLISEFCQNDGNWITQQRISREFLFVSKQRKAQSDRAKSRWKKEKDECRGNATSRNAPTPTPLNISPNGDSSAEADLTLTPSKPADRYPTQSKLPMNGKGKHYPAEFEEAWAVYPVRSEDTKGDCYKHWRSWVVARRVDPSSIADGVRAYAKAHAGDEMRFGFRRWLREGLWMADDKSARTAAPVRAPMPGEWH